MQWHFLQWHRHSAEGPACCSTPVTLFLLRRYYSLKGANGAPRRKQTQVIEEEVVKNLAHIFMTGLIVLLASTAAEAQVLSGDGSRVEGDLISNTEINGAVLAAGSNIQLLVGGIQIQGSRVDGDINSTLRLNGAVLAAGENVTTQVGGVRIANSRMEGDINEYTEVNGAVLAAGQNVDLQVGGVRIEDSRVNGDIDSYTRLNGAVLAAGSNVDAQVGGVSVRP